MDSDFILALKLQEEFNNELKDLEMERQATKRKSPLVEDNRFSGTPNKVHKPESLVDPNWEVIDPTPDIHGLFMNFNKHFFCGRLDSVEVRWSPRMYSCAGVCSYEGRSGLCSVRLSEPLLKLRPRSDLIETLLHEMIHAYLFVTRNNRDRDGHGPEFQKHMHRINKAAGTNITIYHSFHEEVRLYQKHWWRCNGPCKNRPPFFGTVKRSMNRAPGPNDFWWTTHQATCGGKFIKVREPPPKASAKGKMQVKVKPDIRTYLGNTTPTKNNINSFGNGSNIRTFSDDHLMNNGASKISKKTKSDTEAKNDSITPFSGTGHKLGSVDNNNLRKKKPSEVSSLLFPDLYKNNSGNKNNVPNKQNFFGGTSSKNGGNRLGSGSKIQKVGGNAVMNKGTGTLTITSKNNNNNYKTDTKINSDNIVPFSGSGNKLGNFKNCDNHPRIASSWTSTLSSTNSSQSTSSVSNTNGNNINNQYSPEKYKDEFLDKTLSDDELADLEINDVQVSTNKSSDDFDYGDDEVRCPVCNLQLNRDDMPIHLQMCDVLNSTLQTMSDCSTLEISDDDNDKNEGAVGGTSSKLINDKNVNMLPCPCCSKNIKESDINKHLDECLSLLAIKEFENDW